MKFLEFIIWRELMDNLQLVCDSVCASLFVTGIFKWFLPPRGVNGCRTSQCLCLLSLPGHAQPDTS